MACLAPAVAGVRCSLLAGVAGRCRRRLPVGVVWVVVWLLLVGFMSNRRPECRGWMSIRGRPPELVVRWLIRAALVRG